MARQKRSDDWGFPRWRSYGAKGRDAAKVRLCDREGCDEPGDRPAPKSPNSRERWYFCEAHAAEYNKNWNYFAGLTAEEAAKRAAKEERGASGCEAALVAMRLEEEARETAQVKAREPSSGSRPTTPWRRPSPWWTCPPTT